MKTLTHTIWNRSLNVDSLSVNIMILIGRLNNDECYSHPDTFVTITCDKEGLKTMIQALSLLSSMETTGILVMNMILISHHIMMRDSLIQKYV